MRILHFSQTLLGGPASYLEELATTQISTFGANNIRFVLPERDREHVPSIPDACFRGLQNEGRGLGSLLTQKFQIEAEIARFEPDIIHLHSSYAGALVRSSRLLWRNPDQKIVYCAHGYAAARTESPEAVRWVYRLAEAVLALATDRIVNISLHEQHLAHTMGLPREKMALISNGISMAPAPPAAERSGPIRLLFVGRHDPQKGLDLLLQAMGAVSRKDVVLDVVGAPVVSRRDSAAVDLPNVRFHGWMDRANVFRMMERADALIVPSRWEGFGLVAVEAMRAGVAVIASSRGALPDIVQHGVTGLVFDLSKPSALADILQGLERDALARMGREGRRRFCRTFTSDSMNKDLISLYNSLAAARPIRVLEPDAPELLGAG